MAGSLLLGATTPPGVREPRRSSSRRYLAPLTGVSEGAKLCTEGWGSKMSDAFAPEIRAFIVGNFLFGQEGPFAEDQSFLETGIIDSTGLLELVSFIEQRYGIAIADKELVPENLDSLRNVSQFVARKLETASATSGTA